jgi:hypothetical protein
LPDVSIQRQEVQYALSWSSAGPALKFVNDDCCAIGDDLGHSLLLSGVA